MQLKHRVSAILFCLCLSLPITAGAQDEMGATPDVETTPAPLSPPNDAAKPEKPGKDAPKDARDLPPSVEDVPLPPPLPPGTMEDMPVAELQALDKITARVSHIQARVGETIKFGSLSVVVKACRRAPPEDTPESVAFLVVSEQKAGEDAKPAYSGWMFASSPSLAAMDHPVYDIWVVECRKEPMPVAPAPVATPLAPVK